MRFPDHLMTTNCIQKPRTAIWEESSPRGSWPGRSRPYRPEKDFSPVIEAALAAPGFAEDEPSTAFCSGSGGTP